MLKRPFAKGAVAGVLLLAFSAGYCATTPYFDRTAFLEASANLPGVKQQIPFHQYGEENLFTTSEFGPERAAVTIAGVRFTGRYLAVGKMGLWNYDGAEPLSISFGAGARAVGGYFSSDTGGLSSNFTATITVNGVEQFAFKASAAPGSTFFGLVSTTTITNLAFSDGAQYFGLREEQIGTLYLVLNSIPIPSLKILVKPEFQQVALYWPATSPGFVVQDNIESRPGAWLGFALGELGGTNFFASFSQLATPKFYRLALRTDQWQ